jgi:hypothetical protein
MVANMRAVALTKTKPKNISYNAAKAQLVKQELPFVDVTWVPSESDRSGIVALEGHRETILEMMDVHGRRHPLIPAAKDAYWTPNEIHQQSAEELYRYCHQYDLRDAWAYLVLKWYCKAPWALWARSCDQSTIPMASTTMMVESHWSRLKRVYLLHTPRPRLDQAVYVIIQDYCPALLHKWQETLVERLFTLPFETKMVNDWNKFPEAIAERGINPQLYTTDISNWVCSCQPFLKSSYFTCKHLFQVRTKLWTEGHQRPTDINNHNHDGFFGCADVWNRQASTKTNECFPLLSTPFCSF